MKNGNHRTPTCIKLGKSGPQLADWVILAIGIIALAMWAAGVFD